MANNDRKQSSKLFAPRWGAISYVFFSIVINLLRRYATKKYQEPLLIEKISEISEISGQKPFSNFSYLFKIIDFVSVKSEVLKR